MEIKTMIKLGTVALWNIWFCSLDL